MFRTAHTLLYFSLKQNRFNKKETLYVADTVCVLYFYNFTRVQISMSKTFDLHCFPNVHKSGNCVILLSQTPLNQFSSPTFV